MKKHFLLAFSVIACLCAFVSCESNSVISPGIVVYPQVVRISAEGVSDTITVTDSVNVGDTLRLTMHVNGYYDYLKSIVATSDVEKVKVSLPWNEEQTGVLAEDADPENGKLVFKPDSVTVCVAVLRYIPLKSGAQSVHIAVRSNARENYNYNEWTLPLGVR